jgi:N-acetylglutamate synthase-like GNAT family acetyltransferase
MALEFSRFTPVESHIWGQPTIDIVREILPPQYMNTPQKVNESLKPDQYEYYALHEKRAFVGFGALDPFFAEYEDGYEVTYLGVVAEKRARGFGSMILHHLETVSRNNGQAYLYLQDTNTSATFYTAHGYEQKGLDYKYKSLQD